MKVGDLIIHKNYGWLGVVVEVWKPPWKNAKVYWVKDGYDSVCLLSSLIPYKSTLQTFFSYFLDKLSLP